MELLLNLLWLALALPATWLWLRGRSSDELRPYNRLHSCLLLTCVLILLFPVVSATDDLHPMRAEVEDANPLKHIVQQAGVHATGLTLLSSFLGVSGFSLGNPSFVICGLLPAFFTVPPQIILSSRDSRAPPFSHLG